MGRRMNEGVSPLSSLSWAAFLSQGPPLFQLSLGDPCPWTLITPPPPFDLQRRCGTGVLVFPTPGHPHCTPQGAVFSATPPTGVNQFPG